MIFLIVLAYVWQSGRGGHNAAAAVLHASAFQLGLGRQLDEFMIALGEGREIKAKGFDDATVRRAAAVAFALFVVADDEDAGLEQRAVEGFHPRRRQIEEFSLAACRRPGDRPRAFLPILPLRLLDQPADQFEGVRRQTEIGLGLLNAISFAADGDEIEFSGVVINQANVTPSEGGVANTVTLTGTTSGPATVTWWGFFGLV